MFDKKVVFITGGTGSFGKEFVKTILKKFSVKKIIIFSRDELKQFDMQKDETFSKFYKDNKLRFFIGDVRDSTRLKMAMEGVDFVVHAAALKQVPAAEYNPFEVIKTNVIGAQNVVQAALENNVSKVIALSTDKAAAPINLYGATKLASDKLFVSANNYKGSRDIKFSVVRYGNVFGSRGSVVPFFLEKEKSGVLPITDKKMTRFSITLQEGVDFVIQCFQKMWGGEIFVPKIPSYRIMDLVESIDPNLKIKIIGIRPGEKVHEQMITESDAINSIEFEDYYVILPSIELWNKRDFIQKSSSKKGRDCPKEGFSYISSKNDNFLSVNDLKILIERL
tara:strand:- start:642 stop:1649 length:1008 start_codon:yes stop_codon:yes gene_type:complete